MQCARYLAVSLLVLLAGAEDTQKLSLQTCLEEADSSCIKMVALRRLDNIWKKDSFHISPVITIERMSNDTLLEDAPSSGRSLGWASVTDSKQLPVTLPEDPLRKDDALDDLLMNKIGRFFDSHSVKLDLEGFLPGVSLKMSKGRISPKSLDIGLDFPEKDEVEGRVRRHRLVRLLLPLVIGFKMAGALIMSIAIVKLFLIKIFFISKVSLLSAAMIALKKVMEQGFFPAQPAYGYDYYGGQMAGDNSGAYGSYMYPYGQYSAAGSGPYGATAAGGDLAAQYSASVPSTQQLIANATAAYRAALAKKNDATRRYSFSYRRPTRTRTG